MVNKICRLKNKSLGQEKPDKAIPGSRVAMLLGRMERDLGKFWDLGGG